MILDITDEQVFLLEGEKKEVYECLKQLAELILEKHNLKDKDNTKVLLVF